MGTWKMVWEAPDGDTYEISPITAETALDAYERAQRMLREYDIPKAKTWDGYKVTKV
jgi:hypothetical protein